MRRTNVAAKACVTMSLAVALILPTSGAAATDRGTPCACGPVQSLAASPSAAAYRQCNGVYFNAEFSAWFNVDCLVPLEQASPGAFVTAQIPGVGVAMVQIVEVYQTPKVNSPKWPPKDATKRAARGSAKIALTLPAAARLAVNGHCVPAPAGLQEVIVKNLDAGVRYEYRLSAVIDRGGRRVQEERTLLFAAGDVATVDFTHSTETALTLLAR